VLQHLQQLASDCAMEKYNPHLLPLLAFVHNCVGVGQREFWELAERHQLRHILLPPAGSEGAPAAEPQGGEGSEAEQQQGGAAAPPGGQAGEQEGQPGEGAEGAVVSAGEAAEGQPPGVPSAQASR
jgi:hypothetical protein